MNTPRSPWPTRIVATVVLLLLAGGAAVLLASGDRGAAPAGPDRSRQPLRLSGPQFLLNWQSFPGRSVVVEYCTLRVVNGQPAVCTVFDGSEQRGDIDIDSRSFDRTNATWANATCQGSTPKLSCSVRLSGVIRRGNLGRPILDDAVIAP